MALATTISAGIVGVVLLAAMGATVTIAGNNDTITICHFPPGNAEARKTMEVSRSSWNGHSGHGDHKGECRADSAPAPAPSPTEPRPPPKPPQTPLSVSVRPDGDLDGSATFHVMVSNDGRYTARGISLTGVLDDREGTWSVRGDDNARCTVQDLEVKCTIADLAPASESRIRIFFHGGPTPCDDIGVNLTVKGSNDSSTGDNQASSRAEVGPCLL